MQEITHRQSLNVLVVDDEANIRKMLVTSLELDGHQVVAVSNGQDAQSEAARHAFDLAFVDLRLGSERGIELIPALVAASPWTKIVVITAHGSIDSAVETMKRGASDYLTKPFTPAQVRLVTERVRQVRGLEQQVAGLQSMLGEANRDISLDSKSPAMQRALNLARQVAGSDANCLRRGESGTGKGVMAKAIHF